MRRQFVPALVMTLSLTVLLGVLYPLAVSGASSVLFSGKAKGSLVKMDGKVVGSSLLGQNFTDPKYFWPRPSAAGTDGYDATASGGSNLGATDKRLIDRITASTEALRAENPGTPVPVDLVTTSGSGLDPDITPAAALFQVPRVARARDIDAARVRALVSQFTRERQWGVLGERRVNVLALNMALDGLTAR